MPKIVKANGKTFTFDDNVTNDQISSTIDEYFGVKKKEVSQPASQKTQSASKSKPTTIPISSATEEDQVPVVSDGLGGIPSVFPKKQDQNIKSVMYGDGMPKQELLIQSTPLDVKPKKYYRIVSDQKEEVEKKIAELEARNIRLGRRPEDLQREGMYQSLIKTKQQLDEEFKPAERALKEVKKETGTFTRPIETLTSAFTDGKYTLANYETIKLNKDVEDKILDYFDNSPEEIRQKWYKGSLPTEQKEKIINSAKIDVLNNAFNNLKKENNDYLTKIKDDPSITKEEKERIRTQLINKNNAFNAQVAINFSDNLLKNNFKVTDKDKNLDEGILSKYEGFIPETADMVSRFLEQTASTVAKGATAIPTLILLTGEKISQALGTKQESYTPYEATIDLINDTTNYNFLPSSKSEKGSLVDKEGNLNLTYRSITRSLADTLPFTLKIINDVKKGRMDGSPQSMISQLINPSKNQAFADKLRATETAYKVTIGDNYREAKDLGMDDSKAFTYANVMSLAEGVSESIMPDFKYFDSLTGATIKDNFKNSLKNAATKEAVKNVTKDLFKNVSLELGEEEFTLAVEDALKYSLLLNHNNSEFFNIKRQKELAAATVIMSGALGGVAIPSKFKKNRTDIYREVYKNISGLQDEFLSEINSPLTDDETKQSLITAYKFANDISNAIAKSPETVTADQVDLLVKKKTLEEKKKNIDSAFHPDINEEIKGIDDKIRELSKQPVVEDVVSEEEVIDKSQYAKSPFTFKKEDSEGREEFVGHDIQKNHDTIIQKIVDKGVENKDSAEKIRDKVYKYLRNNGVLLGVFEIEGVKEYVNGKVEGTLNTNFVDYRKPSPKAPTEEVVTEEVIKPTTEVISPETSSNYANLTENKDGDFVFFHVGGKGYDKIKKSTGGTIATSKEEASALSKVGGVAMYYTKPDDSETMVRGEAKYAVTIPKEKVYDANTDPNNYAEQAKTLHEEENPGKAFDANTKAAYITKIAGENGYDMVVSEWMGKTRAQTTKEFAPTDVELKEGSAIVKPFEEQYIGNTKKGFKSIIPESKEAKLKAVYDEINTEKNRANEYDELYRLASQDNSKTPQEDITKLIEEDKTLSQEVKDKYAEALAYKPEQRRTVNVVGETVEVKNAPEGHHLNIGLLEGRTNKRMSTNDILSKLPKDVEVISSSEVEGTEPTISMQISRPLTSSEMIKLLDDTKQQAIAQLSDKKGILYDVKRGTNEGWGEFNPEFFVTQDGKNLTELKPTVVKSKLEAFKAKYINKPVYDRAKLDVQVENAKKSLSKILPDVKFVVHDTKESFIKEAGKNGRGYYDPATKTIHINALEANARTVAHEVFHSVLLEKVKTDANARDLTKRMLNSISKTLEGNPELKKNLDDFIKNYDENIQSEEKVAELFGYLAEGYEGFDAPTKSIIKRAMDRLAKMFGLKPFTEDEIVDMLKTLSGKVATGEEIVAKDIKAISEGASSYIAEPTNIERFQKTNEQKVVVGDHKLSFVKKSDLIDIDSLMKEISDKKQNVWFWVADQLGRGNYFDSNIDGEHYLDAGPSFALDPINRDKNVIWASGKNEKEINKLIDKSDYIFIISGSPQKSKLFNKSIIDIVAKRAGDFNKFKKDILESSKIKSINDILSSVNSWDELKDSVKRKEFLLAIQDQKDKNTPLKQTLDKYNSIVDLNEIRDGFYADNNFGLNDIMLVLKPTGFGGKSDHSTYENNILGEVVGVPDIKVNAFDILPSDIKNKYKEDLGLSQQQQAVAPYGIGVKQIERFQESESYSDMKDIVQDMIDDGMTITEIKKTISSELGDDQVSLAERAYNELTTVKEEVVATNDVEAFRDKVKELPQSGIVGKYLSGETIEKVEGEAPRNAQETEVMSLIDAGTHGKETVAMAKEVYGDKYIEKTLEFLDTANLKAHEKAVLYVSLENEMFDRVNAEPDNVGLKKLQDLVRAKSQQFLRESSLAINAGRLRAIMKDGFNYETVTDKFLSSDQLKDKRAIEKAIQSDADAIQKEYESIVAESDLEQMILSGVEKQVNEIYKKLPTARRAKADKAIAALEKIQNKLRGKAYDATVGIPIAIIDSGITIIKNSIKAGVSIADAIEIGINHIKEKYGNNWANEDMFRKDMTEGFKTEGITEKEIKAKELSKKEIVKQALIDAGFGKEITVKTKEGKVKRDVLNWKKLAGEEGSVDKLRENVEKIIGKEDAKELEDEYNNLRASIIEKSLNELENRNKPRKKVDLKTSAKKLSELYNYGLFEKESDTYDHLINTALGMNQLDQKSFDEAKRLAKSLSELFSQKDSNGNPISQESLKHAERVLNKKIENLLSSVAWSQSNGAYKAIVVAKEFIGLAQRNALVSVAQAIENTTSGYISRVFKKIGFMFDNVDTKELKKSRNKLAQMTFKDITMNAGLEFGDVTSPFITKSKTMDLILNASDSRLYHALTSIALGKPFLESADSMHKAALAQGFFHYNLIKILRKKGFSKSEAKNYVSEQLTGQSFEDALVTSKQIIDKINENAGKKVISDSKENIYRFANDLVNEALIQGNNITLQELEAALKSAETVAGFELGHEPNNIISKPLNLFNSWVQTRTDRAVKEKKWNDAAALTAASIVTTNILNPYVGGGTNWTLLAAQKAGIPTLSTIYWNIKSRGSKLDLSTEEGMKNLEKDLKYQLLAKNANARMFIGAAVTLAAFALAKATGADDDLYEWLKKNKWANKYMKKMNPPAVQFMLAQKDKKLGEFLGQQMNIKADAFDEGKKLQRALKSAASGKTQKALGGAGQLIGSRLSTPIIPWRVVRDVRDIYRGLNGLPPVEFDYKASGFGSGYFQGGMIEQIGLRPEDVNDSERESSGNRGASGNRK